MQAKFATAVLLGFVLIGASACGGGGSEDRLQTELKAAQEAQAEAETEAARLEAEKAKAEAAKAEAEAEKAKAEADKARIEAEAQKAKDDAAAAEKKRKDAEAEVEAKEDEIQEAKDDAAEAQRKAQQAQEEADRRIEEAETQADANQRADALIGALEKDPGDTEARMGVTHRSGVGLKFSRPNALPAKGSAPSVPGGWRSASYSDPRGTVGTDTVYLYTNIQPPGSKAFWKVYGEKVETITAMDATVRGLGTTAKSLYQASDGTPENKDDASVGGTYDGYSGTFKCASDCNIEAADDGALTFTDGWTFTASLTAKRSSTQAEQDSEFLYFGIWAFEPTDPVEATLDRFKWAGSGGNTIGGTAFAALEGEATFTGGAIGKYALAKATGRGARAARTGTFTATATFTADFDDNKLSGRLTAFKEGGSSLGADWNVFLGATASTAADLTAAGVVSGGMTHGAIDGDKASGAWTATLHGSDNPGAAELRTFDATKYLKSKYPDADVAGVAGRFNAVVGSGDTATAAIAGAFGAACTTGTMCAK